MKNILSFIIILSCVFYASSCGDKKGNQASDDAGANIDNNSKSVSTTKKVTLNTSSAILDSDSLLMTIKNMTKIRPEEVEGMKNDAEVIIKHRYKETKRKSYIILDKDLWEYEYIFSGKEMSDIGQFAGCWIDFSEDMTYTYGYYGDQKGSGRYTFNLDTGFLLLIDDNANIKPQEFEAKLFDTTLIMDGNDIYKDNNYNAKLKRITKIPSK